MASCRLQVGPVKDASKLCCRLKNLQHICNTHIALYLKAIGHVCGRLADFFLGKTIREDVGLTKSSEEHTRKQLSYGKLIGKRGLSVCSR